MNQILCTGEEELKENVIRKQHSIQCSKRIIVVPVIIVSIMILFSYTIYAFRTDTTKLEETVHEDTNFTETNTIDFIFTQIEEQEAGKTNNENINNIQIDTTISSSTENTLKSKTYKTSNGENYSTIAILKIPSLNIEYPILSSTSEELLKISLNKYWGANPNEVGNMCVVGHNYRSGSTKFFSKLSKIKKNDIIQITDLTGKKLDYKVYDTYVIDPYDTSCTSQLTNGKIEITLITCYNNGKERFVVKARADE